MIKKIFNSLLFVILLLVSCFKLAFYSLFSFFEFEESTMNGYILFAIIYQPVLIIIICYLFAPQIASLIYDFFNKQGNILEAIILCIGLIAIILFANALIELLFRIICKEINFETFFSAQKKSHDYIMALISLIAIYAAIKSNGAFILNTMLLAYGIIIFICIFITDLYKKLFLEQSIVKRIYSELQISYNHYKK